MKVKALKIMAAMFFLVFIINCAALTGSSLTDAKKEDPTTTNPTGNFDPEEVPDIGPTASTVPNDPTANNGSVMAPQPGYVAPTPVAVNSSMARGVLTLPPGTPDGVRIIEFQFDFIVDKFWGSFVSETSPGVIPVVIVKRPSKTIKFVLRPTTKDKPYTINFGYDIDTWAVDLKRRMKGKVFARINGGPWVEFGLGNTESGDEVHWNFMLYVP